jgi:4-oxalocrotonate tautomerase
VTAVIVTSADPEDWFCGGRSLTDVGLASFWLDIHIVDGTNTKDEKAAFIAATFEAICLRKAMCTSTTCATTLTDMVV